MYSSLVEGGVDRMAMIGSAAGLFEFNLQYQEMQIEKESRMISLIRAAVQYAGDGASAAGSSNGQVDAVLLCDRGTMDSKAHVPAEVWAELLGALGQNDAQLCEGRYDAVLHFVTQAHRQSPPQLNSRDTSDSLLALSGRPMARRRPTPRAVTPPGLRRSRRRESRTNRFGRCGHVIHAFVC